MVSLAQELPRMNHDAARMLSRRTQLVWATFFVTMTAALLILQLGDERLQSGLLLTKLSSVGERPQQDPVFASIDGSKRSKWTSIVIHHLGQPAGTAEMIDRNHRSAGLDGLGFHFLIGNGNGLGDGDVHVGYRWLHQGPGAKPVGIDASRWSDKIISICLIGNGNRRPFTKRQMLHLSHLVQRLQKELSIPSNHVFLASDIGDDASPGEYFAEAQFHAQLLDIPADN